MSFDDDRQGNYVICCASTDCWWLTDLLMLLIFEALVCVLRLSFLMQQISPDSFQICYFSGDF